MLRLLANPSNFVETLKRAQDGDAIGLEPGEYKGPFLIDKSITICGSGAATVIFTIDEPALVVKVPGVRLENLTIQRTVEGDTGAVVVSVDAGTSPILKQVKLLGTAPNVQWEGASWNIPRVLDFEEIEPNRQVQRSWELQLGETCEVLCDLNWLHVQPSHLSPGVQTLEVRLDSTSVLAGTILSGSIFLKSSNGSRKIEVSAKIKKTSPPAPPLAGEGSNTGKLPSGDWGYRFLGSVDNLLCDVEGKQALEKYADFSEKCDRAEKILSDILGTEPRLFYVRRKQKGEQPGEEKWEVAMATDIDEVELPELLKKREKTLSLLAVVSGDGYGGLRLLSARLVPQERGHSDGFSVPCRIRLRSSSQYGNGVPRSALSRVKAVPFVGDRVPAEEQLAAWKAFLNIEERIAKTQQFCVPFRSHNYGSATRRITFEIRPTSATIDRSSGDILQADDFWNRALKARNEDIKFLEIEPDKNGEKVEYLLGSIEDADREQNFIRIRLESDLVEKIAEGRYQLPEKELLYFEAVGELIQIKRQINALENLNKGRAQNPCLSDFFFDASKARPVQRAVKLDREDLLLPDANDSQIEAVEKVLSAQDLVLIQGPPGTGKTTVIAEICYQVAQRGGRTLIASQANLAVDNALSRLIHSPIIRALRKGRAARVEEEGLPFLEDQVMGTWLKNTADDCEKNLKARRESVEFYRQLLGDAERFEAYVRQEEAIAASQKELRDRKASAEENLRLYERKLAEAEAKLEDITHNVHPKLGSLLQSAPSVDWEDPDVIESLNSLRPYTLLDDSVRTLKAEVETAVKLTAELGMVPPNREIFGLADWLRKNLPDWIEEVRIRSFFANDAIAAIFEAESAASLVEKMQQHGTQQQVEKYRQEADLKINSAIALLQDLAQFSQVSEKLPDLAELSQNPSAMQNIAPLLSEQVREWENLISQFETQISSFDIWPILAAIKQSLANSLSKRKEAVKIANRNLTKATREFREIEALIQEPASIKAERDWWQSAWQARCDRLQLQVPSTGLFALDFLRKVQEQFGAWEKARAEEEDYLKRYENLVSDWIARLRNPSEQDLSELRRIYIDNANVIGITCSQAASKDFALDFNNFDVVIIDEVSKCTPPELLIPALKGKKLVLIGDYRQLPPMLHEHTLEEIAEEMGSEAEDLSFLEESLFKRQFESAPESIKQRLNIQYRMHPVIMGAINQFYEHRLECGIAEPERQRAHNLTGGIIQENHHLIWIKTLLGQGFEEQKEGTSRYNEKEIEVIDALCQQMEDTWSHRVAEGEPRKEIGIITFYGAQLRRIEEMLGNRRFPSLRIRTGTVDRFQGMEQAVIIVSMVRNNSHRDVGFAKKPERVNVAFSRARELLAIVGCHSLFTEARGVGRMYSDISKIVRNHGGAIDVSSILS